MYPLVKVKLPQDGNGVLCFGSRRVQTWDARDEVVRDLGRRVEPAEGHVVAHLDGCVAEVSARDRVVGLGNKAVEEAQTRLYICPDGTPIAIVICRARREHQDLPFMAVRGRSLDIANG